jgi:hypothetical protein
VIIGQNNAIAGFTGRECSSASFRFRHGKDFVMTRIVPSAFDIQGFSIAELRGILRCELRERSRLLAYDGGQIIEDLVDLLAATRGEI